MEGLRIAICDDEDAAHREIEALLSRYLSGRGISGEILHFHSGEELTESDAPISVLLLDIEMPGVDGFQAYRLYRSKKRNDKCVVIMLSGIPERFKEAFQIGTYRFVTKPIDERELHEALDDALREIDPGRMIPVRFGNQVLEISEKEILYLQAKGDYVLVRLAERVGNRNSSLAEAERELSGGLFVYCSRSHLVNLAFVRNVQEDCAILKNGERIRLSRRRRKAFEEAFLDYQFRKE